MTKAVNIEFLKFANYNPLIPAQFEMISFVYALKVLLVGILIGGGLMFASKSRRQANGMESGGFLAKLKVISRFFGKAVIFLAMLLLPFALLKLVGLI
jgi:hypothetical protein